MLFDVLIVFMFIIIIIVIYNCDTNEHFNTNTNTNVVDTTQPINKLIDKLPVPAKPPKNIIIPTCLASSPLVNDVGAKNRKPVDVNKLMYQTNIFGDDTGLDVSEFYKTVYKPMPVYNPKDEVYDTYNYNEFNDKSTPKDVGGIKLDKTVEYPVGYNYGL
jgi:hypothetical protein